MLIVQLERPQEVLLQGEAKRREGISIHILRQLFHHKIAHEALEVQHMQQFFRLTWLQRVVAKEKNRIGSMLI